MAKPKRMGSQDSATSQALLDAVETVLRDEGYAAATSRRVAELAGTTQQLVYYYFRTVDDLLLAAWKRRTARGLARLQDVLATEKPLRAIWADFSNSHDARLTFEYMALANRHAGIREETARFIEEARALQAVCIGEVFDAKSAPLTPVSPSAVAFLLQAVSLLLCREKDTGASAGHSDIEQLLEWAFSQFD